MNNNNNNNGEFTAVACHFIANYDVLSSEIREYFVSALSKLRDDEILAILIRSLGEDREKHADHIVRLSKHFPASRLKGIFLSQPLPDGLEPVFYAILSRCGLIEEMRQNAYHNDWQVREEAIKLLLKLKSPELLDFFLAKLDDPCSECRCLAVEGITRLLELEAVYKKFPEILSRVFQYINDPDYRVTQKIVDMLVKYRNFDVIKYLSDIISDPTTGDSLKVKITKILKEIVNFNDYGAFLKDFEDRLPEVSELFIDNPDFYRMLTKALHSNNINLRRMFLKVLGKIRQHRKQLGNISHFLHLKDDPDALVRCLFLNLVSDIESIRGDANFWSYFLKDPSYRVRSTLARILGKMKTPFASTMLKKLFSDASLRVKAAAAAARYKLGEKDMLDYISSCLNKDNSDVRIAFAFAVVESGISTLLPGLLNALDKDLAGNENPHPLLVKALSRVSNRKFRKLLLIEAQNSSPRVRELVAKLYPEESRELGETRVYQLNRLPGNRVFKLYDFSKEKERSRQSGVPLAPMFQFA